MKVLHKFARDIVANAEAVATRGGSRDEILDSLRRLSLDDFGSILFSLPDNQYPGISAALPAMADVATQKRYTGATGTDLLMRSLSFVRQMETTYVRNAGRPLRGSTVLDFGVGYGRIVRLLYYYTDPINIWGVDPDHGALDLCRRDRLAGNFRISEAIPKLLPVDGRKFDLAIAFSVFTHLPPRAADAALSALREATREGGLLLATIWPPEIWDQFDHVNGTSFAAALKKQFSDTGFAYLPHAGSIGETFGRATVGVEFFSDKGWKVLGYDSTVTDPFQVVLILQRK